MRNYFIAPQPNEETKRMILEEIKAFILVREPSPEQIEIRLEEVPEDDDFDELLFDGLLDEISPETESGVYRGEWYEIPAGHNIFAECWEEFVHSLAEKMNPSDEIDLSESGDDYDDWINDNCYGTDFCHLIGFISNRDIRNLLREIAEAKKAEENK